jgi:hypothetical protein
VAFDPSWSASETARVYDDRRPDQTASAQGLIQSTIVRTYAFVNTFSPEDAADAYERHAVPETGQIFYEAGFANFHLHPPTEVHFEEPAS